MLSLERVIPKDDQLTPCVWILWCCDSMLVVVTDILQSGGEVETLLCACIELIAIRSRWSGATYVLRDVLVIGAGVDVLIKGQCAVPMSIGGKHGARFAGCLLIALYD